MKIVGRILMVLAFMAVGAGVLWFAVTRPAVANQDALNVRLEATQARVANAEARVKELTDNPIKVTEVITREVPVEVEKIVEKVVEVPVEVDNPVVPIVIEADAVCNLNGELPAYCDSRAAVRKPGDVAKIVIRFTAPMTGTVLSRVWPDDILEGASFQKPGSDPVGLLEALSMITVTKTFPADANLRAALKTRGVNIAEGELLPQNKNQVYLGVVPAGAILTFYVKDNEALQVNRGAGVAITSKVDPFTVGLDGKVVK